MPAKSTKTPEQPAKTSKGSAKAAAEPKTEAAPKAAKAAKSEAKAPAKAAAKPAAKAAAKPAAPPPAPPARKALTQAELVDRLAAKSGANKAQVKAVLDEVATIAGEELAVGFTIPGIGKFGVRETAERQGRNPSTGATITIAAGKKVKFTAAAALKRAIE